MMKHVKNWFISGLLASLTSAFSLQSESLSFDTLYPETWYSNALSHCMQIWADIDVLEAFDDNEQARILDSCLGRIVYCDFLYSNAQKIPHIKSSEENIPYLIRGLTILEKKCCAFKNNKGEQKLFLIVHHIQSFKKKLLDSF